jgi:DNA repair protein RadA/Sms
MAAKTKYKCSSCAAVYPKWDGQCASCGKWNTLEEDYSLALVAGKENSRAVKASTNNSPQKISEIDASEYERTDTKIGELNRVLGGGLVPGGVILLAGPPGCGKSTLTLHLAGKMSNAGKKVLIVSGEESAPQIASRAKRIGAISDNLTILAEVNLANAISQIEQTKPDLLIIDSVQTILSPESDGRVGSPSQVSEVASQINATAKILGIPTFIIGHITKDGNIAGPRVVEHLVDVVLYFEVSKDSPLRLLRAVKNRFGATDEIGCFQHTSEGLEEVSDPSGFLTEEHETDVNGYANSILVEGLRALPIEITALVTPSPLPNPRKITHGLDNARVLMIQAILEKYGNVRLNNKDVYVSTTGGIIAKDASIDLCIAAAIISSHKGVTIPENTVFLGELSLTGEIRPPKESAKRTGEAERLGYTNIVSPKSANKATVVKNVRDLVNWIN